MQPMWEPANVANVGNGANVGNAADVGNGVLGQAAVPPGRDAAVVLWAALFAADSPALKPPPDQKVKPHLSNVETRPPVRSRSARAMTAIQPPADQKVKPHLSNVETRPPCLDLP
jgi:hypothetical protein